MDDFTRQILLLARTLVSNPYCWTHGAFARDWRGRPVPALDEDAMSWCALGAVYKIAGGDLRVFGSASSALEGSAHALYGVPICAMNDSPSPLAHAAVLRAFDHAIDEPIEWPKKPSALLVRLGVAAGLSQEEARERFREEPAPSGAIRRPTIRSDDSTRASRLA